MSNEHIRVEICKQQAIWFGWTSWSLQCEIYLTGWAVINYSDIW